MAAGYIIAGLRAVLSRRRIATLVVSACIAATLVALLVEFEPVPLPKLSNLQASSLLSSLTTVGSRPGPSMAERCRPRNHTDEVSQRWQSAQDRYANLTDDKFTIAIQAYKQSAELDEVLRVLLTDAIPSLREIVVVWNDADEEPPGNFKSEHGVLVRYRVSPVTSRNQVFVPDAGFSTRAVLLSDADVYYRPDDLEFVFRAWRSFGQARLTGALARCAVPRPGLGWEYGACSADADADAGHDGGYYSMVVTNLCFAHLAFLDFYSSDDPVMTRVREYVDENNGCESIAMNFMASYLTGHGQLLVQGRDGFVDMQAGRGGGADQKPVSAGVKSRCLSDLSDLFGCMPLVDETAFLQRGVGSP